MKKLLMLGFAAMALSLAAQTEPEVQAPPVSNAKIKFTELSHNFGNVIEGQIARYEFKFTNEGTDPLVLENVHASCGCTTPKWPREPIAPGASEVVIAEYNSNGRPGTFNKQITVNSNGGEVMLTITGVVIKEPEKPKSPVIIKGN
jgi:Protein of unknown function (DUF1573)